MIQTVLQKALLFLFAAGLITFGLWQMTTLTWWRIILGLFTVGWGSSIILERKQILAKAPQGGV